VSSDLTAAAKQQARLQRPVDFGRARRRVGAFAEVLQRFAGPQCSSKTLEEEADSLSASCGFASIKDLPRAQQISTAAAVKEVDNYRHDLAKLLHRIRGMHSTSLAAFKRLPSPLALIDQLAQQGDAARQAAERLRAQPPKTKTGRRGNTAASTKTDVAARAFRRIGGGEPRGQRFERFLAEIFKLSGEPEEKTSVKGQLKLLEKRRSKTPS